MPAQAPDKSNPTADPTLPVSYSRPINRQRGSTRSTSIAGGGALAEWAFKKLMAKVKKACKTGRAGPDQEAGWRDLVGSSGRMRRSLAGSAPYGGFLSWVCLQLDFWESDLISSDDGFHVVESSATQSGLPEAGLLGNESCLHLENGEDSHQLTKLLITRGVDPNTRALLDLLEISSTKKLATPLQDAVNNHKRARIDLLLAHGADPNMVASADGLNPLEVALRQRSPEVVDALLRHGAAKYAVANPTNNGSFNILTHPDALEGLGRRYGCASGSSYWTTIQVQFEKGPVHLLNTRSGSSAPGVVGLQRPAALWVFLAPSHHRRTIVIQPTSQTRQQCYSSDSGPPA
ncbi:Nacht and ankyrin domain protein [Lasiodiplodia theobromae]|uniref:Nacht and ankyrin domain protein n=1 Tax=Lasiodiplodia theobromae TaxID=45133 RepID=UPI0015C355F9|nr:Nacht and ankyrin domain protein [Lasiodiplodia theobromae]KAF4544322.1 Nacht and ankyrin domain protein [Lasiodiplodia theobromae]